MTLTLTRPWLEFDLGAPHRVLSWSLARPGFARARHILWREVRNADLPVDLDVVDWLRDQLRQHGHPEAIALLTSRDLTGFETATSSVDGVSARCVATVGLSNAERIGTRLDRTGKDWGTINLAIRTSCALSDTGLIEALSVATEARTAAIIDTRYRLPTGIATGTGTDCIAVAAPAGEIAYAGLHTPVGEAIGQAVYTAVRAGAKIWMDTVRRRMEFEQ